MSDRLLRIAEKVRARLEERRARRPLERVRELARGARRPHDFAAPFSVPGTHVIAEIKLASPSEGDIAPGADPVAVAGGYLAAGAAALSVLTEQDHFKGHPDYLRAIRARHPGARLLMKDFVVDPYQVYEAREMGADAVLLIVALLGDAELASLHALAGELGLSALVETHDEAELARAARLGARLIGVNNRDLRTMQVSLETSVRLAALAPRGAALVTESGLKDAADLRRLRAAGFGGFLIGTSFMRAPDPGAALARLLAEAGA